MRQGDAVWRELGPRVRGWLIAEVPKRKRVTAALWEDCVRELGLAMSTDAVRTGAARHLSDWPAIKGTVQPANGNGSGPVTATAPTVIVAPKRTLDQYLLDKRKAECPVCKLHPDIRAILKRASEKGSAKVAEQLEWLRVDCGASITASELTSHRGGGHET